MATYLLNKIGFTIISDIMIIYSSYLSSRTTSVLIDFSWSRPNGHENIKKIQPFLFKIPKKSNWGPELP